LLDGSCPRAAIDRRIAGGDRLFGLV